MRRSAASMTSRMNLYENDSEIETVARDCIGVTVAYILEWFGIPIDMGGRPSENGTGEPYDRKRTGRL